MAERSPSRSEASTSGSAGYIEHTVSKLDTLAGVAIKYGVEVFHCPIQIQKIQRIRSPRATSLSTHLSYE